MKRTVLVWLVLVIYFVVGYSIAPYQKFVSPALFSNIVLGTAFVAVLGDIIRRRS